MPELVHAPGCFIPDKRHPGPCQTSDMDPPSQVAPSLDDSLDVPVVQPEAVVHPQHYGGDTTYETIKVLAEWMSDEQFAGFLLGNTIKYLSRAGKKDALAQDLKKAAWYLDRYISHVERTSSA